jgi:hypothetical protein
MTVLVCGSRGWGNGTMIRDVLATLPLDSLVIHGGARGADNLARVFAALLGHRVVEVGAKWEQYGKGAGHRRNEEMLDMHPDKVIAFMLRPETPGTADMIAQARAAGVPVEVYYG